MTADGRLIARQPTTYAAVPALSVSPAYSVGDVLGGKLSLTTAVAEWTGGFYVSSIQIVDRGNKKTPLTALFFNANPSTSTLTDNGAVAIADADDSKVIGSVDILASDYTTCGAKAFANKRNLEIGSRAGQGQPIYVVLVAQGIVTPASVADLQINFGIDQN